MYQISVLFRRNPEVSVTPPTQVAKLLDLRVCVLYIVFDRQPGRIIYAHVASQTPQDTGYLEGKQFGIRPAVC